MQLRSGRLCSSQESLKIPYDLECIIDDWILMAYLVGNDFIPHLPHVHIKEEALSILWEAYKKVLPTLDGSFHSTAEISHECLLFAQVI